MESHTGDAVAVRPSGELERRGIGQPWGGGDVLGAGFLLDAASVFFTLNGRLLGTPFKAPSTRWAAPLHGACSFQSPGSAAVVVPPAEWAFDPGQLVAETRREVMRQSVSQRMSHTRVVDLIQEHFLWNGLGADYQALLEARRRPPLVQPKLRTRDAVASWMHAGAWDAFEEGLAPQPPGPATAAATPPAPHKAGSSAGNNANPAEQATLGFRRLGSGSPFSAQGRLYAPASHRGQAASSPRGQPGQPAMTPVFGPMASGTAAGHLHAATAAAQVAAAAQLNTPAQRGMDPLTTPECSLMDSTPPQLALGPAQATVFDNRPRLPSSGSGMFQGSQLVGWTAVELLAQAGGSAVAGDTLADPPPLQGLGGGTQEVPVSPLLQAQVLQPDGRLSSPPLQRSQGGAAAAAGPGTFERLEMQLRTEHGVPRSVLQGLAGSRYTSQSSRTHARAWTAEYGTAPVFKAVEGGSSLALTFADRAVQAEASLPLRSQLRGLLLSGDVGACTALLRLSAPFLLHDPVYAPRVAVALLSQAAIDCVLQGNLVEASDVCVNRLASVLDKVGGSVDLATRHHVDAVITGVLTRQACGDPPPHEPQLLFHTTSRLRCAAVLNSAVLHRQLRHAASLCSTATSAMGGSSVQAGAAAAPTTAASERRASFRQPPPPHGPALSPQRSVRLPQVLFDALRLVEERGSSAGGGAEGSPGTPSPPPHRRARGHSSASDTSGEVPLVRPGSMLGASGDSRPVSSPGSGLLSWGAALGTEAQQPKGAHGADMYDSDSSTVGSPGSGVGADIAGTLSCLHSALLTSLKLDEGPQQLHMPPPTYTSGGVDIQGEVSPRDTPTGFWDAPFSVLETQLRQLAVAARLRRVGPWVLPQLRKTFEMRSVLQRGSSVPAEGPDDLGRREAAGLAWRNSGSVRLR